MKDLAEKIKEKNLKVTPQRLAIYNILIKSNEHPTAEIIYKELEEQQPNLSLATVYKTLDAFKKAGLVNEIAVGDYSLRYDGYTEQHGHVVCQHCNKIIDYADDSITDKEKEQVFKTTGIKVSYKQLYFYGVCEECQ